MDGPVYRNPLPVGGNEVVAIPHDFAGDAVDEDPAVLGHLPTTLPMP
jgi:hypothetical protein